jgi:hypothetical protein
LHVDLFHNNLYTIVTMTLCPSLATLTCVPSKAQRRSQTTDSVRRKGTLVTRQTTLRAGKTKDAKTKAGTHMMNTARGIGGLARGVALAGVAGGLLTAALGFAAFPVNKRAHVRPQKLYAYT